MDDWRRLEQPSVLCLNSLASGVGIDLSQADIATVVELEWVPSDLQQLEARLQAIHGGGRTTSPVVRYVLAKGTIDEAMAAVFLDKTRMIDAVVGADPELSALASIVGEVADKSRLHLSDKSEVTVLATLAAMRDRWLSGDAEADESPESLARGFKDAGGFGDDEEESNG
jgi:SNF2 family DNA or RNA helicase